MNTVIHTAPTTIDSKRLSFLDELRGLTLISMILYHFMWDLVYIAGFSAPWYHSDGAHLWQQSICWTFILLSGFCWPFGHHPIKRGLTVFAGGALVTLATLLFVPEDAVIFGVLTLIGSSMLFIVPLDFCIRQIDRKPITSRFPWILFLLVLLGISFFLFILFLPAQSRRVANFTGLLQGGSLWQGGPALPAILYRQPLKLPRSLWTGYPLAYLGFPAAGFFSTDYFPVIPWFFLYLSGYLLHKIWTAFDRPGATFLQKSHLPPLAFLGRHCLLIYMLHQPVLYAVTQAILLLSPA